MTHEDGKLIDRAPVTELRLRAGECFAAGVGMLIVQDDAREAQLRAWKPELDQQINRLARYIVGFSEDHQSKSHRVRLDALGLAIVMYGVRRLERELKRGHFKHLAWPERVSLQALVDRLEKFRKRAKRAWFKRGARDGYQEWHRHWREFLDRLRSHQPARPAWWNIGNYYRETAQKIFNFSKRTMVEAKFHDLPDDKTLKKLVGTMMRNARRGRGGASIRDFLVGNERGRGWVLKYMKDQVTGLRRKLIKQAYADPNCQLAQSARSAEEAFEDIEELRGKDWIFIRALRMSLAELQRACHAEQP